MTIHNRFIRTPRDQKDGCACLRRSKLESYEAILEALIKGPLTVDKIAYETSMEINMLGLRLDFLIGNGLAEERVLPKKTLYAITERGVAVFKTLNFCGYIEKMSDAISAIDDAMNTLPIMSRDNDEPEKEEE